MSLYNKRILVDEHFAHYPEVDVKEAIKELVERLLNKIFIGSKNVSYKVSFCQREIPKAIEEIFGAELCSEEDLK